MLFFWERRRHEGRPITLHAHMMVTVSRSLALLSIITATARVLGFALRPLGVASRVAGAKPSNAQDTHHLFFQLQRHHHQHQRHVPSSATTRLLGMPDDFGEDSFGAKAMQERTNAELQEMVSSHNILAFIKGNRLMPQCGYSGTLVNILQSLSVPYETVDVLADERIRQGIKDFSNWPTIPQLYLGGEFIGGADIVIELYQSGELQEMIEVAAAS